MPPILDVAIGTLFVFLLFSLVVSALNEYLLSLTDQRAKFLRLGLLELLGQGTVAEPKTSRLKTLAFWLWESAKSLGGLVQWKENPPLMVEKKDLLKHGLLNGYSRSGTGTTSPSYIPAGAFVTALMDILLGPNLPSMESAESTSPEDAKLLAGILGEIQTARKSTSLAPAAYKQIIGNIQNLTTSSNAPPAFVALLLEFGKFAEEELTRVESGLSELATSLEKFEKIATRASVSTTEFTAALIEARLGSLLNSQLSESLLSLFRAAGRDVRGFKVAVEGWFNGVMDRVGGWYRRFTQKWMIALGFILAIILNVDTIAVVRVLSTNPNLVRIAADKAALHVAENKPPYSGSELDRLRTERLEALKKAEDEHQKLLSAGEKKGSAKLTEAEETVYNARADLDYLKDYRSALSKLSDSGLPIGWTSERRKFVSCEWFAMLTGWFITAIAASLGAPFWFDLLNRFVNIRAAGRAPGEKDVTSTPTRPAPANLDTTPGTRKPTGGAGTVV